MIGRLRKERCKNSRPKSQLEESNEKSREMKKNLFYWMVLQVVKTIYIYIYNHVLEYLIKVFQMFHVAPKKRIRNITNLVHQRLITIIIFLFLSRYKKVYLSIITNDN